MKLASPWKLTVLGHEKRTETGDPHHLSICSFVHGPPAPQMGLSLPRPRILSGNRNSVLRMDTGRLGGSQWLIGTRKHKPLSLKNLKQIEAGCHLSPGNKLVLSLIRLCLLPLLPGEPGRLPRSRARVDSGARAVVTDISFLTWMNIAGGLDPCVRMMRCALSPTPEGRTPASS